MNTLSPTRATGGGELATRNLTPEKAANIPLPPALRAPRTYQTITVKQRSRVVLTIAALSHLEAAGVNYHRGCCNPRLCERDRAGIRRAVFILQTYAVLS